jgi:HPt (histidine-containing phosphotransfer) domain-containing protein
MTINHEQVQIETAIFDLAALKDRVENDMELLDEMIELYLSNSPQLLNDIEDAVAAHDCEKINRAAHTLKGVLKNMCANACAEAALRLENMAKTGDLGKAEKMLADVQFESQRLESHLTVVGKKG